MATWRPAKDIFHEASPAIWHFINRGSYDVLVDILFSIYIAPRVLKLILFSRYSHCYTYRTSLAAFMLFIVSFRVYWDYRAVTQAKFRRGEDKKLNCMDIGARNLIYAARCRIAGRPSYMRYANIHLPPFSDYDN